MRITDPLPPASMTTSPSPSSTMGFSITTGAA
jgi:hypothetical protein